MSISIILPFEIQVNLVWIFLSKCECMYKNVSCRTDRFIFIPLLNWKLLSCLLNRLSALNVLKSYLLQFSSSELSLQSFWLSHRQWSGIQLLFLHWNSWGPQVFLSVIERTRVCTIEFHENISLNILIVMPNPGHKTFPYALIKLLTEKHS